MGHIFYSFFDTFFTHLQVVLVDVPLCLGDTLADWLQAGGLILGVDGLREDTARYFWIAFGLLVLF